MHPSYDSPFKTSFCQDTAEKILGVSAETLGETLARDEEEYNQLFTAATFKTFNFKMRAKNENYNDENRVKHSVVEVSDIDHQLHCASLIREIEKLGGSLPESVNRDAYVK